MRFPGWTLVLYITSEAYRTQRLPSQVWIEYQRHPLDYKLLHGYQIFEAEIAKRAREKEEERLKKQPR
jgi:hypothetical protein